MSRVLISSLRAVKYLPALAVSLVAIASPATSFGQAVPRVTQPVNESALVTLKGNTHPWAKARFDRGPVEDAHTGRMLLLLKRSDERDQELRQLIQDQQNPQSPNFHKWLKPDEFGTRFGVADADVESVTGYLQAKGFTVGRIYKNKGVIEVSGTAGQLRDTFHTQMHMYSIGGKEFYANANDPQIPAALAPVVRGFAALNNFQASQLSVENKPSVPVEFDAKTHRAKAQYTGALGANTVYLLAPADIQKIYSIQTSTSSPGAGGNLVTIGVIGDSQVNLNLIANYQSLGGFGANLPVEIVDGSDPVIVPTTTGPDAIIAYEQLELLSAVAPNANVNYYVSSTTDFDTGLDFAIIRAVEDDAVSVLTMGFQSCEKNLTAAGNQLVESAWMQAAAQGITVSVAAGDTGSGGCDIPGSTASSTGGLAVNGYASTPYDTAVGGTDFAYGTLGAANYWNAATTPPPTNYESAKSYIPEQAWNDSIQTNDSVTPALPKLLYAGGGGYSSLGNVAADNVTESPYPVPSWQTTALTTSGLALTGRSVPDVSFFAGNGYNSAYYVICSAATDCAYTNTTATLTGGTAGAAAVFAGVMAQVVAQNGPQGNANATLYGLAATAGVYNDVVLVNGKANTSDNSLACTSGTGCITGTLKKSTTANAYPTGVGYDQATGLGSINVSTLLTNWKNATGSSTTSLVIENDATLAPITGPVVHGTPLRLIATVTGSTPTGNVAFTSGNAAQGNNGIIAEPLVSGVATSAYNRLLSGGTYNVTARYEGNSTNLPSVGVKTITVTPEPTHILSVSSTYPSGSSVPYGTTVNITVEPFSMDNNDVEAPTGTIGFHFNSNDPLAILPLSSEGTATLSTNLFGGGQTYYLVYAYSGDKSYEPSTTQTTPYIITITQAATTTAVAASGSASVNTPVTLSATVASPASQATGVPPTGTVTFNNLVGGAVVANLASGFNASGQAIGVATIQVTPAQIPSGGVVTANYSSDVNYAASGQNITLTKNATSYANTTLVNMLLNTNTPATDGTLTATVSAQSSAGTPAGKVQLYANGVAVGTAFAVTAGTGAFGTPVAYTIPFTNGFLPFPSGTVAITAIFSPTLSASYAPSSTSTNITVSDDRTVGDFSVSTDVQTQTLSSTSNILNFRVQVTAVQNFAGLNDPISLSCTAPNGLTCAIGNNYVTVGTDGTAITTLTISGRPTGGTGALHAPVQPDHWWMVGGGSALACIFIIGIPARRKGIRGMMAALVCVVLVSGSITGCGSSNVSANAVDAAGHLGGGSTNSSSNYSKGIVGSTGTTIAPGNYPVVVTATSTSNTYMVHNTSVNVVVISGQVIADGVHTLSSFGANYFGAVTGGTTTIGYVLDANGSTAAAAGIVQNAPVAGNTSQQWNFVYQSNGYYLIQNVKSGYYLTDPNGAYGSVQLTQQPLLNDGTQAWTLSPFEGGFEIVNGQAGGNTSSVGVIEPLTVNAGDPVVCNLQRNVIDGYAQTYYIQ